MASRLTPAERDEVDRILKLETDLGYEIQYDATPERLPFIHPADAEADRRARQRATDTGRAPTAAEVAEADKILKRTE